MALKIVERGFYTLIAALASGKVYAMKAPQNVQGDFIIYQTIDSDRFRSINNPSGIAQAIIQVDCYSNDYLSAKELRAELEETLDGYSGRVSYGSDSPQDFVDIEGISLQNESDVFDQTDEPFLYRNFATFLVTYKQR